MAHCLSNLENSCKNKVHPGREISVTLSEIILHDASGAPYGCPDTAQHLPKCSRLQQPNDLRKNIKIPAATRWGLFWRPQWGGKGAWRHSALAMGWPRASAQASPGDLFLSSLQQQTKNPHSYTCALVFSLVSWWGFLSWRMGNSGDSCGYWNNSIIWQNNEAPSTRENGQISRPVRWSPLICL